MPESQTNPLPEAALAYARMGVPVFPCAPGRKTPTTVNGFHDATTDEAAIRTWWKDNPRANIGMPTGAASGLIVLDVDPRHGGEDGIAELESHHGKVPDSAESITGGGGRHIFLAHPGSHIPCSQGKLAPGVDVKGDGGYVLLPPSVHPNGTPYIWEVSSKLGHVSPVACPAWLVALAAEGTPTPHGPTSPNGDANPIPEGQRNATLTRLAGSMRRHGMTRDEIAAALLVTNQNRCLPPIDDREVQSIAVSVSRYEPDAVSVALVEDHYAQDFNHSEEPETSPTVEDPGPLPEEMLRVPGFVGELMDHCLETAPYPNHMMAFSGALSLLAFLTGRKVRDPGDNRTNLYLLGLAHSAAGKDWPRKLNTRILHAVGLADCLGDRFASGEGIQDALFLNPCMLFQTDEVDGLLQSINKARDARHESIMGTLLTMYSSSNSVFPMRRKAGKHAPGVIDQPHLVVFGTAIPNHYYSALSERMLTNGFFARMLVLESGQRVGGQEPRAIEPPERVLQAAAWWADYRPGERRGNLGEVHPTPATVPHDEAAQAALVETRLEAEAEYARAEACNDPVGTTVWGRVSEHARKLALLFAVSEDHLAPRIGGRAARWASSFVLHQTRRMLFMASCHAAESEFHGLCLKALKKLREAPCRRLTHSKLLKRMKLRARDFKDLIDTLKQRGEIREAVTPRAGSSLVEYVLVEAVNAGVNPGGIVVKPAPLFGAERGSGFSGFTQVSPGGGET